MSTGRVTAILKPIFLLVIIIAIWEIAAKQEWIPTSSVAAPTDVTRYMINNQSFLFDNVLRTLLEVSVAFVIVVIAGTTLAVLISQFRLLEESLFPLLVASQVVPSIAIAPLLVLFFGFGLAPKIAVACVVAIFPILVNTVSGLKAMPQDMGDLARSMGASRWQTLRRFSFPNALPYFFAGARVSVTLAVIGAVVGEFITADKGLGYLVIQASSTLDPALLFSALVCLAIMGLCLFSVIRVAEYLLVPWARAVPWRSVRGSSKALGAPSEPIEVRA